MPNNMQSNEPMISQPVSTGGAGMPGAEQVVAEQVTVAEAGPVFTEKKKGKGMLLGLILCLLIAAGGIGFGVWAMMDKNTQVNNLNGQISSLNSQIATLQEQGSGYENPVIESGEEGVIYSLGLQSSYILGYGAERVVDIGVKDGQLSSCSLREKFSDVSWRVIGDCNINGLEGNIYKVIEFGEGQENSDSMIGFIMENGQVAYFKLYDLGASNSVSIRGYLNIDNYVIDAIGIGVIGASVGNYGSTVFVMSDGSFVKYDASMLD